MSWAKTYKVVIDHTKVPNTDQVNFPVLFLETVADFATIINGGVVTSSSGYDIIAAADSSGVTLLNFDRAAWDATTGAVQLWVQIPNVSHTVDTVFYLLAGNSSVVADQQNKPATWSNSYKGVFHLEDDAANTVVTDASGNQNLISDSGVNTNVRSTTGELNKGFTYNPAGNDDTNQGTGISLNNILTFSAWINVNALPAVAAMVQSNDVLNSANHGVWYYIDNTGNVHFELGGVHNYTLALTVSTGTWYYIVITSTGDSGTATGYLFPPGGPANTDSTAIGNMSGVPNTFLIGANSGDFGPQFRFDGTMDEVHFADVARSADWINTEFNNQSSPGTFYSFALAGSDINISIQVLDCNPSNIEDLLVACSCVGGVPLITSFSPVGSEVGSGDFTLTINGLNFRPDSIVRWNGVDLVTTFVSSTQLTAAVPGANIVAIGVIEIDVINPPPGCGASVVTEYHVAHLGFWTAYFVEKGLPGQTYTCANCAIDGNTSTFMEITANYFSLTDSGYFIAKWTPVVTVNAGYGDVTVTIKLETQFAGAYNQVKDIVIMSDENTRGSDRPGPVPPAYKPVGYDPGPFAAAYPAQTMTVTIPIADFLSYFTGTTNGKVFIHAEHISGFLLFNEVQTIRIYDVQISFANVP